MGRGGARTAAKSLRAAKKCGEAGTLPYIPSPHLAGFCSVHLAQVLRPEPLSWSACTEAPDGYQILDRECPLVDTEEQQKALIGRPILHAWDSPTGVCMCRDPDPLIRELLAFLNNPC